MPPGLTASLTSEEFVHLVSFLSKLGKEGPFRFPKEAYVRSVEIPTADTAQYMKKANNFIKHPSERSSPLRALVDGHIPVADIPLSPGGSRYLRFRLQADDREEIRFSLSDEKGLRIQRGGREIGILRQDKMVKHSVDPGTHVYVVTLASNFPADTLRIQLHSATPKVRLLGN